MIILTLKLTDRTESLIPRFTRFLEANQLKVSTKVIDPRSETIELMINARFFGQVQYASKLAQSCFDKAIVEIRTDMPISAVPM